MGFGNPVVAGTTLVRQAIRSPNYVASASGWTINRDGSAEFNNMTVRGDLLLGTYPAGPYIYGRTVGGVPAFEFGDGLHSGNVRLETDNGQPTAAARLIAGIPGVSPGGWAMHAINQTQAGMSYESLAGDQFIIVADGPNNEAILYAQAWNGSPVSLTASTVRTTPDGSAGRLETQGELLVNRFSTDAGYPSRVVKGKANQATTGTTIGTSDTNVLGANIQNVYLRQGYAYRCIVQIDMRNANAGGRLEFKLWDGTPGVGNRLGGIQYRWTDNASAGTSNGGTVLIFVWKQTAATGVYSNINLSAVKTVVTAAAATVEVNPTYSALIEKIGDPTLIAGL